MTSPYSELIMCTTRDYRAAMECMRCNGPEETFLVQQNPDILPCLADYITAADRHNAGHHPELVAAASPADPGPELSDRCPRCWCGDCGGLLAEHTETSCGCSACDHSPELACSLGEFLPDKGIDYIAGQLGPLLSVHLGEKQRQRCRAVAHAANHALRDYDQAREVPDGA